MELLISVGLGFILDLIFGDPHWMPHPIRFIGFLISKTENLIRKSMPKTKRAEFIGGIILNLVVITVTFCVPYFILLFACKINYILKIAIETIFCYQIFATKSLKTESLKVYKHLILGGIRNSRKYLSYIVGRDTKNLSEEQIIKATVETVAENTCDGVIAPLIFMLIGGAPLAFLYKAVNTLDSMVGYKNQKYINFGKFSARLDDVFNFIPAILSAYLMLLASLILKLNYKNAYKIYKRDRFNHASPNSAKTESVCAGALGIQLLGDAYYFGKLYNKKTVGDKNRNVVPKDIILANKLMYTTAICGVVIYGFIKMAVIL